MSECFRRVGSLEGHSGWVTKIASTPVNPNIIVSSSRDKSIIVWRLTPGEAKFGVPHRRLTGHNHFVSDVVMSNDGEFCLSASWDSTLRLWDLKTGKTTRRFVGHTKDVLSVAFSPDNRQIVSSSRDKTIKLWNALAECKYTIQEDGHTEWVSRVAFSPNANTPLVFSVGWDKMLKVWNLTNCKLRINHSGHTGYLNTVAVSPDGSLCASGGKDGMAMLWEATDEAKHLSTLNAGHEIHALVFSPNRYWLCAAAGPEIVVWDLENKSVVERLVANPGSDSKQPQCLSLSWSADGQTLFAGYDDNVIRVYEVAH